LSAFSATLSTPALDRRTWRWFAALLLQDGCEGSVPSSLVQHRISVSTFYIDSSIRSWRTNTVQLSYIRVILGSCRELDGSSLLTINACPTMWRLES
jgi:hypothetical protein